ncbi:protein NRT1/ PTR FAMILY 2.11-like [Populus alba x Populus x berolinensis]|uniref:Protein NRT1/ PTR FAMILY 2.9-like n=1 Tax=Populus alba TaxID=43335 RepID=A0A4U5P4G9_POPAL|nr:protein NRT1/ PTR FAMILY 2.11-like [Populus alba]KAJ6965798.1 protein NRT1/ PTR FAMILY 2.11-like [Populus alba x Populus x berolinensis]TKR90551.1 protein NRT1/ PTR FAMILY 2.9-like [Populus alba]
MGDEEKQTPATLEISMENGNLKEEKTTSNEEPEIKYGGIKAMPFVIGNETFEKLGTVGSSTNLAVYLTTVFNMKSVTATTLINVFTGTTNLAPLIGAYLSDTYFGRYWTLGFASVFSFLGMVVLMLTAAISTMHPPKCAPGAVCAGPTSWQLAFLLSGFAFLVIGAGGIRPCNLAFGADQFNPNTESGKRGITSFFNWYYFTFTFAVMISVTGIVYVQSNVSWAIGLGIPAFLMLLSCVMFFVGTSIYVIVKPQGSPITGIVQVLVAATKKRGLKVPDNSAMSLFNYIPAKSINSKLPRTEQFRCLDKAAIITDENQINLDGTATNPWKLCSIQQVEEVKCLLRIIPIWSTSILYHIPLLQQQTYAVFQALQMDRRLGTTSFKVPAATYIIFTMLTLTIWIPLYDRIIVPFLQRLTGKDGGITLLQRMGIGMILAILCTVVSGLVEENRRHIALTRPPLGLTNKGGSISSMSGMWLIPQLALSGLSEGFNYIAQIEFYYKQFPENMRSIAGSAFFAGGALSNYLSGVLVSVVHQITSGSKTGDWLDDDLNKGKLDYFYYVIAGLGILNFGYFLLCAKWYRYKDADDSTVEMATKGI